MTILFCNDYVLVVISDNGGGNDERFDDKFDYADSRNNRQGSAILFLFVHPLLSLLLFLPLLFYPFF
jgi:hypothetical protein